MRKEPITEFLPRAKEDAIPMQLLCDLYGADRENVKAALLAAEMSGANVKQTDGGYYLAERKEHPSRKEVKR